MHLSDGDLRSYIDGESPASNQTSLQSHLDGCPQCRQRIQEISHRAAWVGGHMDILEVQNAPAVGAAWQRLRAYQNQKEKTPMLKKIFSQQYRTAWIALGLVAALALALA